MSVFDKIANGLQEAIAYERGELHAKTTQITIQPIEHFKAEEIREIRIKTGMTQVLFAEFMGVSKKTVEAWESGRNQPVGSACRLLDLAKRDPSFPEKVGIIIM